MPSENVNRDGKGVDDCATVDVQTMDEDATQNTHQRTMTNDEKEEYSAAAISSKRTPHHETQQINSMSVVQTCHYHGLLETSD